MVRSNDQGNSSQRDRLFISFCSAEHPETTAPYFHRLPPRAVIVLFSQPRAVWRHHQKSRRVRHLGTVWVAFSELGWDAEALQGVQGRILSHLVEMAAAPPQLRRNGTCAPPPRYSTLHRVLRVLLTSIPFPSMRVDLRDKAGEQGPVLPEQRQK